MTPGRTSLEALISGCGISLDHAQLDQLWAYHRMLRSANAELNLTRIHNFENMVLKHYVDSLLVLRFVELPSPLIDMGSGPGLPGVPLKIARPGVSMILAEPRGARAEFLEEVCGRLKLVDVEVYAGKIGSRFPRRVRGVITRAVASIPETLDRVADCLEPGGKMIFMKGPDCEAEIVEARSTHAESFRLILDKSYQIPGTPHDRRIVVYERLEGEANAGPSADAYVGTVRDVASEANPTYKLAIDLLGGKGIRKHGRALIAGPRVVAEVLGRFPDHVEGWVTDTKGVAPPDSGARPTWLRLADPLFRNLDTAGTRSPLLLVKVPEMPTWTTEGEWPEGCTLFVPFQDPRERRRRGPIGRRVRRGPGRPPQGGRPSLPPQGRTGRRHGPVPGPARARAVDPGSPVGADPDPGPLRRRPRHRLGTLPRAIRPGRGDRRPRAPRPPPERPDASNPDGTGCRVAERRHRDGHRPLCVASP